MSSNKINSLDGPFLSQGMGVTIQLPKGRRYTGIITKLWVDEAGQERCQVETGRNGKWAVLAKRVTPLKYGQ